MVKLSQDPLGKEVEEILYRTMIRSLLYVTASHTNITPSILEYVLDLRLVLKSLTLSRLKESFNGMPKFGIWYPHDTTTKLFGYSDVEWVGCNDD